MSWLTVSSVLCRVTESKTTGSQDMQAALRPRLKLCAGWHTFQFFSVNSSAPVLAAACPNRVATRTASLSRFLQDFGRRSAALSDLLRINGRRLASCCGSRAPDRLHYSWRFRPCMGRGSPQSSGQDGQDLDGGIQPAAQPVLEDYV